MSKNLQTRSYSEKTIINKKKISETNTKSYKTSLSCLNETIKNLNQEVGLGKSKLIKQVMISKAAIKRQKLNER